MSPWPSFTVVVQSVSYNSWWPHGLQHTRLLYPPLSPGVCSSSCPLRQWCYLTISFSAPFSSHLQSFPASGSFSTSRLFESGGQSIGASASASVLPMNIQSWSPLGITSLISAVQGTLKSLLQHHSLKASVLQCPAFFMVQFSHLYMTTGKTIALTVQMDLKQSPYRCWGPYTNTLTVGGKDGRGEGHHIVTELGADWPGSR